MANVRMSRINSEIQKAIADIIANRLNNPDFDGLIISVTHVDTAADLSLAKVGISVLANDETERLVVVELNHAKNFIRYELKNYIRIKTLPDLEFKVDNSYEDSQKLLNLIDKVSKESKNG